MNEIQRYQFEQERLLKDDSDLYAANTDCCLCVLGGGISLLQFCTKFEMNQMWEICVRTPWIFCRVFKKWRFADNCSNGRFVAAHKSTSVGMDKQVCHLWVMLNFQNAPISVGLRPHTRHVRAYAQCVSCQHSITLYGIIKNIHTMTLCLLVNSEVPLVSEILSFISCLWRHHSPYPFTEHGCIYYHIINYPHSCHV